MKVKTSVALSEELLSTMDRLFGKHKNRSRFIEKAVWEFVDREARRARDMKDLDIINRRVGALNSEAEDVLLYQVDATDHETR